MASIPHWLLAAALIAGVASPAFADVDAGVAKWRAGDFPGAVAEWKGPAASGNRDAQFNLGQAYKLGRGVPADQQAAIEWYRKAAAQGHQAAEANLGWVLFQTGKRKEALPLLQRAAGRGDPHSQYLLGVAYFNGDVVPTDWTRAYRLMTASAASGLPQARDALAQMDARIPLADRQRALASLDKQPGRAPRPAAPRPGGASPAVGATAAVTANAPATKSDSGKWRVQLGAFSTQKAAAAAWSAISGRVSGLSELEPSYVRSGNMVRLQAGPVIDRATANGLCGKVTAAGAACFPVQWQDR